MGPTRTEQDFAVHIAQTIGTGPAGPWRFIVGQLNTHKSEALVRLMAVRCEIHDDLEEKGKVSVLQSMATRAKALQHERAYPH